MGGFENKGQPDYTGYITFNDDVVDENIKFLIMVWQTLGDKRVLDPIKRAMDVYHRRSPAEAAARLGPAAHRRRPEAGRRTHL